MTARARESRLRIVSILPTQLGTYGDGGNVRILAQRARWSGVAVEVLEIHPDDDIPTSGDLYVLGGGEDTAQEAALEVLRAGGDGAGPLGRAVNAGAHVLAVCAGLQLLGESFMSATGTVTPGLGLLDLSTGRLRQRAVGEVVAAPLPELGLPALSGFENHGGHTVLGPGVKPLAVIRSGVGNGPPNRAGEPTGEGAVAGTIIASYLHGPLLGRNPALADLLLARATGLSATELAPPDVPEHAALRRRLRVDGG